MIKPVCNIKKFTDESEHSLEEIAKIIKVTDRQLFRYRTGMSEVPAIVLYNLCTVLDKDIKDMFMPAVTLDNPKNIDASITEGACNFAILSPA